jgi:hypothetical protein
MVHVFVSIISRGPMLVVRIACTAESSQKARAVPFGPFNQLWSDDLAENLARFNVAPRRSSSCYFVVPGRLRRKLRSKSCASISVKL